MNYAIPPSPPVTLPVDGTDAVFPVLRVFCVGRNYAEHAVEMGHDPDREPPFFFMKPASAVVPNGGRLPFPLATDDLHHEVELVVGLSGGGEQIPVDEALRHVFGYAVGLDMTRRDLQSRAKEMGRPWDMGKGFDRSAPMSAIRTADAIGHPDAGAIWLRVNGDLTQEGDLAQQIWKVPETIAYLSTLVEIRPGDLIMTGTPKGVGRVVPGDVLEGHIDGVGDLRVEYAHSMQRTVFDAAGGMDGLRRLAGAWHARVMADEVVSHAFSHGFHPEHTERLAAYWAEALGGPTTYSEAYGNETSVVRMHSGNGVHDEMDRRAIARFDEALVDVGLAADDGLRQVLHDYFAWATTTTMSRYHYSADDVPDGLRIPRWSWAGLVE